MLSSGPGRWPTRRPPVPIGRILLNDPPSRNRPGKLLCERRGPARRGALSAAGHARRRRKGERRRGWRRPERLRSVRFQRQGDARGGGSVTVIVRGPGDHPENQVPPIVDRDQNVDAPLRQPRHTDHHTDGPANHDPPTDHPDHDPRTRNPRRPRPTNRRHPNPRNVDPRNVDPRNRDPWNGDPRKGNAGQRDPR